MPYSQSLKNLKQIMPEDLTDHVLLFIAGDLLCAIPLSKITFVLRMLDITQKSKTNDESSSKSNDDISREIEGFFSYHGEEIPVYSIINFFGEQVAKPSTTDNLIIIDSGSNEQFRHSSLWVRSIIGVYGREDLLTEKNHKKSEEHIKYDNNGLKIYIGDLATGVILLIEEPGRFIRYGSMGMFKNLLNMPEYEMIKNRNNIKYIKNNQSSMNYKEIVDSDTYNDSLQSKNSNELIIPKKENLKQNLAQFYTSDEKSITPKEIKKILDNRSKQIAKSQTESWEDETIDLLRFRIMYKEYAFEMKYIREVLIYDRLTPVPGVPEYISGIYALRGEIISLVDLRKFFSLPSTGITDLNIVIVLTNGQITFGILADYITDVGTIPAKKIKESDDIRYNADIRKYIKGIVDDSLIVFDAEALLLSHDMIIDD